MISNIEFRLAKKIQSQNAFIKLVNSHPTNQFSMKHHKNQ